MTIERSKIIENLCRCTISQLNSFTRLYQIERKTKDSMLLLEHPICTPSFSFLFKIIGTMQHHSARSISFTMCANQNHHVREPRSYDLENPCFPKARAVFFPISFYVTRNDSCFRVEIFVLKTYLFRHFRFTSFIPSPFSAPARSRCSSVQGYLSLAAPEERHLCERRG